MNFIWRAEKTVSSCIGSSNECQKRILRDYFYFVDRFHGSALHGDWCTAGREAHTNIADEINMPDGR
jgi:hypothetical protein